MRFDYEIKEDDRECVAFVCEGGLLAIKCDDGKCVMINPDSDKAYNGAADFNTWLEMSKPVKRLYEGDKITITF